MDEGNILSGGIDKLNEIKENLMDLYTSQEKHNNMTAELEKIEKNIKSLEKAAADEVQTTVKKRRSEMEGTYNKQLDKINSEVKKIKDKRDKTKNMKVSERIKEETASLRKENRRLKDEAKNLYRQKHVPFFCNSGLYYALYYPMYFKDIIIILFTLLLTLFVIPCGIYFYVLPEEKIIYLILLYIASVVVFGGLYLFTGNRTKSRYGNEIGQGIEIRRRIATNKKKIAKIKRGIKKDRDESSYGLEEFDSELARLEREAKDLTEQKKEALSTFENTTARIISSEIRKQYDEKITSLKAEYNKIKEENTNAEEKIKALTLKIANEYEPYLGKDLITIENINSLINTIQAGNASNISEAVQFYRKNMG